MNKMRYYRIFFLMMLVGIAGCESREAVRRRQLAKNLKQIGLALHAYHADSQGKEESDSSDKTPSPATGGDQEKAVDADQSHPQQSE